MANQLKSKSVLIILGALLITTLSIQCTKEGVNAGQVSRALVDAPDSTVFSPFYDSTVVAKADAIPDVNDFAVGKGVLSIVKNNCASSSCHGSNIKPLLNTFADVKALVVPGNPDGSKLFQMVTTSNLNEAMPPINYGVDLSITEKTIIYNWILHGAKETPDLQDFRPSAIALITNGCASANCHNAATVGGEWARKSLITFAATDTINYVYINPGTGAVTNYCQLQEPKLSEVWKAYKDSVKKFYPDTVANAAYRPYKTFGTPIIAASRRGPLNTYDDILMDIMYPKAIRSNSSVKYTDPVSGKKYYVAGDNYNSTSSLLSRVDSTILLANPRTGTFATSQQGDMAYGDGGLKPGEIGLIKAWYFADPNIPDTWKYGLTGNGIFKYRKTGNIIKK